LLLKLRRKKCDNVTVFDITYVRFKKVEVSRFILYSVKNSKFV
jgi:hypothetical protein